MSDEKQKQQDTGNKIQVILAVIGLVGTIGVAMMANWDKIFPKDSVSQSISSGSFKSISTPSTLPPSSSKPPSNSGKQRFAVISGESNFFDSLKQEPIRAVGFEFRQSFPNIKVCPSKAESGKFYLVIGYGLSESEANSLKQQAIAGNFRSDTYIIQENVAPFSAESCLPL